MKLVYCIPSLEKSGGTERVLTDRVNFLVQQKDYEIYIVTTDQKSENFFFPLSPLVKVIHLNIDFAYIADYPLLKKIFLYRKKQNAYRKQLQCLLLKIKPDITTSFLSHEIDFFHRLCDGSRKIGENHFNKSFRYDFLIAHRVGYLKRIVGFLRYKQLIRQVKKLDHLVVLTNEEAKAWPEMPRKRVIPNWLASLPSSYSTCERHEVVAVGRYVPEKGFDFLLRAWQKIIVKFPYWNLVIYGDGICREEMNNFIIRNQLNNVRLAYPVSNVYEVFKHSSISVLSSRFEGFGMVIIEAMACGVPVVAFNCKSGPSEIITHNVDGYLVSPENVQELADRIMDLMNDQEKRKQFGSFAKQNVHRFTQSNVAKKWIELYNEIKP